MLSIAIAALDDLLAIFGSIEKIYEYCKKKEKKKERICYNKY
jgi:hypothetical protein